MTEQRLGQRIEPVALFLEHAAAARLCVLEQRARLVEQRLLHVGADQLLGHAGHAEQAEGLAEAVAADHRGGELRRALQVIRRTRRGVAEGDQLGLAAGQHHRQARAQLGLAVQGLLAVARDVGDAQRGPAWRDAHTLDAAGIEQVRDQRVARLVVRDAAQRLRRNHFLRR